jgi:hypothetical protein
MELRAGFGRKKFFAVDLLANYSRQRAYRMHSEAAKTRLQFDVFMLPILRRQGEIECKAGARIEDLESAG